MANPTIRAMAFYWKDKKAATVNQTSVKIKSGRSALMGAEGLLAFSRGAVMFDIDIDEVVPVSGSTTVDAVRAARNWTASMRSSCPSASHRPRSPVGADSW